MCASSAHNPKPTSQPLLSAIPATIMTKSYGGTHYFPVGPLFVQTPFDFGLNRISRPQSAPKERNCKDTPDTDASIPNNHDHTWVSTQFLRRCWCDVLCQRGGGGGTEGGFDPVCFCTIRKGGVHREEVSQQTPAALSGSPTSHTHLIICE